MTTLRILHHPTRLRAHVAQAHGPRLRTFRTLLGLTQTQLAGELGLARVDVARIERGTKPLTDEIVNWLHVKHGYPPEFFTAEPGVTTQGTTTFASGIKPKKHAAQLTALFDEAARMFYRLSDTVGYYPTYFDGLATLTTEQAAVELRNRLGIQPDEAIPNATRALEDLGVGVILNLAPNIDAQMAHLTMSRPWAANTRPLVATLAPTDPALLRFRLLHELGHLIYDSHQHLAEAKNPNEVEQRAHDLAFAVLIPAEPVRDSINENTKIEDYIPLMVRFGVGILHLLNRARALGAITSDQRANLGIEACSRNWHLHSPVRVTLEAPGLIADGLDRAYANDLRAASLELGTPEHLLAQWAGIEPDDAPVPDNVVPLARA